MYKIHCTAVETVLRKKNCDLEELNLCNYGVKLREGVRAVGVPVIVSMCAAAASAAERVPVRVPRRWED